MKLVKALIALNKVLYTLEVVYLHVIQELALLLLVLVEAGKKH